MVKSDAVYLHRGSCNTFDNMTASPNVQHIAAHSRNTSLMLLYMSSLQQLGKRNSHLSDTVAEYVCELIHPYICLIPT